jgi:hypothetical protein
MGATDTMVRIGIAADDRLDPAAATGGEERKQQGCGCLEAGHENHCVKRPVKEPSSFMPGYRFRRLKAEG